MLRLTLSSGILSNGECLFGPSLASGDGADLFFKLRIMRRWRLRLFDVAFDDAVKVG